jgi:hypothetical protein
VDTVARAHEVSIVRVGTLREALEGSFSFRQLVTAQVIDATTPEEG